MTRRVKRGGNSEDYQFMFLGDVDTNGGENLVDGSVLAWDETSEKFKTDHNALATAHGLTANISAALSGAASPGAANVYQTDSAVDALIAARGALNVLDYGAVGNDSTDNLTAFTNALAALPAAGGALFIPRGIYQISNKWSISKSNVYIFGEGAATVIKSAGGNFTDYVMIEIPTLIHHVEISHLKVYGAGTGNTQATPYGIHGVAGSYRVNIHHCWFENLGFAGAIDYSQCYLSWITHCDFYNCRIGVGLTGGYGGNQYRNTVSDNHMFDCMLGFNGDYLNGCVITNNYVERVTTTGLALAQGMWIYGGQDSVFMNNIVKGYYEYGVIVGDVVGAYPTWIPPSGWKISNNHIGCTYNVHTGLWLAGLQNSSIVGNTFRGTANSAAMTVDKRVGGAANLSLYNSITANTFKTFSTGITETAGGANYNMYTANVFDTAGTVTTNGANSVSEHNI